MNMKVHFLAALMLLGFSKSQAQLKATPVCPTFSIDILDGSVNKLYPKMGLGEIKAKFPCYTSIVEVPSDSACAGIFFKDKGLFFYTDRNYIEANENYKGTMTPPLMGADRKSLFSTLGNPRIKDAGWEAYQMQYGILVLYFTPAGKINKVQISNKSAETLKLCN